MTVLLSIRCYPYNDSWAWYINWRDRLIDGYLLVHEHGDRGLDMLAKVLPIDALSSDGTVPACLIALVLSVVQQWKDTPVPTPDTFHVDIRHWFNAAALVTHLSHYDPSIAPWAKGVTVHHTEVPTPAQWRGLTSMQNLVTFYKSKGWDGGPHLFLCVGAPNPTDDGIWQLTPLNMPGIHAGVCNADHWGLEVVGDYDVKPWPVPVADLVYGAAAALLNWRDIGPAINGHRECLSNKTCPGSAINMDTVRAELARRMANSSPTVPGGAVTTWRCIAQPSLRVRVGPGVAFTQAGTLKFGDVVTGVLVSGTIPPGEITNQWLHIGDKRYAWAGLLQQVQG